MSLPRPPRAILFDLDGTLIDSEALVREAYLKISGRFGAAMTDTQFLSLVGLHRDANDAQLRAFFGADFPLEDFYTAVRGHMDGKHAPLKPGARELLDRLDDLALPYALATSSGRPWVERHFIAHALTHRFAAVFARGDYQEAKPHPEPYLKAAAALGVAPENALALEDSYHGVRAAHASGAMTIMVPDLLAPNEEMREKALRILPSLHEVMDVLNST